MNHSLIGDPQEIHDPLAFAFKRTRSDYKEVSVVHCM